MCNKTFTRLTLGRINDFRFLFSYYIQLMFLLWVDKVKYNDRSAQYLRIIPILRKASSNNTPKHRYWRAITPSIASEGLDITGCSTKSNTPGTLKYFQFPTSKSRINWFSIFPVIYNVLGDLFIHSCILDETKPYKKWGGAKPFHFKLNMSYPHAKRKNIH